MVHDGEHAAWVERWLERGAGLPPSTLVDLFEAAVWAIWSRAIVMLGAPTLEAVTDRVLSEAAERWPFLSELRFARGDDAEEDPGAGLAPDVTSEEVVDAIRFAVSELLRILGALTGDVLTDALRSELAKVGVVHPPAAHTHHGTPWKMRS